MGQRLLYSIIDKNKYKEVDDILLEFQQSSFSYSASTNLLSNEEINNLNNILSNYQNQFRYDVCKGSNLYGNEIDNINILKYYPLENHIIYSTQYELRKLFETKEKKMRLIIEYNNGKRDCILDINNIKIGSIKTDSDLDDLFFRSSQYYITPVYFNIRYYYNSSKSIVLFPIVGIQFIGKSSGLISLFEHFSEKAQSFFPKCPKGYYISCRNCNTINPFFSRFCSQCRQKITDENGQSYDEIVSNYNKIIKEKEENIKKLNYEVNSHTKRAKRDKIIKRILAIAFIIVLIGSIIIISSMNRSLNGVRHRFTVVNYSETVPAGANAYIEIRGTPNQEYQITVEYDTGKGTASGLNNHKADNDGTLIWSWKVGNRTNSGKTPVVISDGHNELVLYIDVT